MIKKLKTLSVVGLCLLSLGLFGATPEVALELKNSSPSEGSFSPGDETTQKVSFSATENYSGLVYFTFQDTLGLYSHYTSKSIYRSGVDSYGQFVELKNGRGGFWITAVENDEVAGGDLVFTLRTAQAGEYVVDATRSSVSVEIFDNDAAIPEAPSSLALTSPANNQVRVVWVSGSVNQDGFWIYRSLDGVSFSPLTTVVASPFVDTNLAAGTYYYRVSAYNVGGESSYLQDSISLTVDAPGAPTGVLAAAVSASAVEVSWTDGVNEASYDVLRDAALVGSVGQNVTSYVDSGLAANTSYAYTVRAVNAGGSATSSPAVNATTHPDSISAPSLATVSSVTEVGARFSWQDNSSIEENFKVQIASNASFSGATETLVGANITELFFTGLVPGTQYWVRVSAYTTTPSTLQSSWVSTSFSTSVATPATPTNVAVGLIDNDSVLVSWAAVSGATSYRVEQSSGGAYATVANNLTATSRRIDNLSAETTYNFRVVAVNNNGPSSPSSSVSITMPSAPTPPTGATELFVQDGEAIPWSTIDARTSNVIVYFDGDGSWQGGGSALGIDTLTNNPNFVATFDGNSKRYNGSSWEDWRPTQRGGNVIQRVRSQNSSHRKINNIVIRGFTIFCNTAAKALSVAGDNWIVEDCDISHGPSATDGALAELIPTADGRNHDPDDEGSNSYTPPCDNVIFRRNYFHHSYGEGLYIGGGALYTGYPAHTRVKVQDNEFSHLGVYGGQGDAIDYKGGISGLEISGNYIHDLSDEGSRAIVGQGQAGAANVFLSEWPNYRVVILRNRVENCVLNSNFAITPNGGSWAQPSRDVLIANNLIVNCTGVHGIGVESAHQGRLEIANNTIVGCTEAGIRVGSSATGTNEIWNNALWSNNGGGNQISIGATLALNSNNAYSGSYSPAGSGNFSLSSSPFIGSGSYDITNASALHEAGRNDSRVVDDIRGNARVGTTDVGAYEAEVTGNPPVEPPVSESYTHWVTVDAPGGGTGTKANPWTIIEAWDNAPAGAVIHYGPGWYDTKLRGPRVAGTATSPILHKADRWGGDVVLFSPGETINGDPERQADPGIRINAGGDYNHFYDFRITSTNRDRQYTEVLPPNRLTNPPHRLAPGGSGIAVHARGIKLINCIIDNTGMNAIEHWGRATSGGDCEYYGILSLNNGVDGPDRGHGHGFYAQNGQGFVLFEDCDFSGNAGSNGQFYGSSSAVLRNGTFRGNTVAFGEILMAPKGSPMHDLTYVENKQFDALTRFGYEWGNIAAETPPNSNWNMQQNMWVQWATSGTEESAAFTLQYLPDDTGFIFSRNEAYRYPNSYFYMASIRADYTSSFPYSNWQVEDNVFGGAVDIDVAGFAGARNVAEWNSAFGASDTSVALPTQNRVFIRPNKYDENRFRVIVFNFSEASTVNVDASQYLSGGQAWLAYDAHDPFKGVHSSGSGQTVVLPMAGRTKAQPLGLDVGASSNWKPVSAGNVRFGVFIVFKL